MKSPTRITRAFAALVVGQTAHSVEEYLGRLWETFPPARALTSLVSSDREVGFLVINFGLVAFGYWCLLWPVQRGWRSAESVVWFWVVIETINGIGHPAWSVRHGGYTPGVATAVPLLAVSAYLAWLMVRQRAAASSPTPAGPCRREDGAA